MDKLLLDESEMKKIYTENDAILIITMKAVEDGVNTEVTLHEKIGLDGDLDQLKAVYMTALGSLIGCLMERYPVGNVLAYIKAFLEEELEGKDQPRH